MVEMVFSICTKASSACSREMALNSLISEPAVKFWPEPRKISTLFFGLSNTCRAILAN
ncbi:hypothetical protein D9M73_234720 [compost metagenome]